MPKKVLLILVLVALAALILPNIRSLYEGVFFYLRDVAFYNPSAIAPVKRDGRYASIYDLSGMRNSERHDYVLSRAKLSNTLVTQIPISNSQLPDIFVRFGGPGPYTIFSAHYDKLHDDPAYQGASDNTGAVSVLLASVAELAQSGGAGNRAFLFTGEEETGLRGAKAFYEYARANGIAIREVVNFDNLGRGKLAIRPSASIPGYVFTIPFLGDFAYDGRALLPSPPYPPANTRLTQALVARAARYRSLRAIYSGQRLERVPSERH